MTIGIAGHSSENAATVLLNFGLHDMAIGPVGCGGRAALKALMINGRVIVENDVIPGLDLELMRHQALSAVRTLQQRGAG